MSRKYTLKADTHDMRDQIYRASIQSPSQLPKSVDLRSQMSPVVDQGQLGSCTANAIGSGLREFLILQEGKPLERLSRLYLYWHERELEGTINQDSGAMIRDGLKVLQQRGIAPENDYPYDITKFATTPSSESESDALNYRISSYHRVTDLNMLKASLAEGLPVVIGMSVYESFESQQVANTGKVPVPKRGEQNLGGHAVLVVGYTDTGKTGTTGNLIVRNSWGEGWGDKGYCYIPYSFISKGIINDMWTGK